MGEDDRVFYLIGVPIGNPEDLSVRARRILSELDFLICEERKAASTLYRRTGLSFPGDSYATLNEHTSEKERSDLLQEIQKYRRVGLISDAGMPVICDPGEGFIQEVEKLGFKIQSVPGPTALTTALARLGRGGHEFYFAGYPPRKTEEREFFFQTRVFTGVPTVFYETPYRMKKTIGELVSAYKKQPDPYTVTLAVSLTEEQEFVLTDTPEAIQNQAGEFPDGPPVFIIHPVKKRSPPGRQKVENGPNRNHESSKNSGKRRKRPRG